MSHLSLESPAFSAIVANHNIFRLVLNTVIITALPLKPNFKTVSATPFDKVCPALGSNFSFGVFKKCSHHFFNTHLVIIQPLMNIL
jgi:hypothetical protein